MTRAAIEETPTEPNWSAAVPVETQLAELAHCGIRLREGVTVERFLSGVVGADLERVPYLPLLFRLGSPAEDGRHWSDDIWQFDLESLDGPGAYARIALRLRELAQGELPLDEVRDHFDPATGEAWVEYRLDGQTIRYEAEVAGDWADLMPVYYIAEELDQRDGDRRFTLWDEGGRYALVGCGTWRQMLRLKQLTGLEFEWFTE